jgi:2-methylcitrate dehydratase PrpD
MADKPTPRSGLEGKFSLQYTVACALVDGHVGINHFTDECLSRPEIRTTLAKVELSFDESRPAEAQRRWVDLIVKTEQGKRYTSQCKKPAGHYHLPVLALERHLIKVRDCLDGIFNAEEQADIIQLAGHFHELDNADVRRLLRIVSRADDG